MTTSLKGRSLLELSDLTPQEIRGLLDLAATLKREKKAGTRHPRLAGKNIVLVFEKTSTRTRCAFEVAAYDLGMGVTYLDPTGSQIGHVNGMVVPAGHHVVDVVRPGFDPEHVEFDSALGQDVEVKVDLDRD